ncbi:MAG: flagellum-specific ATP synthase FliI, partial [Pseudomonadota bacterium]
MTTLLDRLERRAEALGTAPPPKVSARVLRYDGLVLECAGFSASPGTRCLVETETGQSVSGEIVGFDRGRNLLLLDEAGARIGARCRVHSQPFSHEATVGDALLGRVIDADGTPLDGRPPPATSTARPLGGSPLNPLTRQPVRAALDVGVRMINAGLTVGRGQRLGIIAGSGVGKSVLVEMLTRYTDADVIVVGLIGERAREVTDFVTRFHGGLAQARTVIVAVPADRSPLQRLRAAQRLHAIAEHFRGEGKQVLLIMDSLTRVAHARREVGLALGEAPTAKGYPPSALALIPTLLERAGPGPAGEGAITA